MLSVVSENNTPILPYIAQRDSGAQDVVATHVLEQCADFERPRFYHGEPACEVRLAVALTTALLALRHDPQAVVVHATAPQACPKHWDARCRWRARGRLWSW